MKTLICLEDALNIAMQYCPDDDGSCSKPGVDIREMLDELESLPSVQPERKKGKWIEYIPEHGKCPFCGNQVDLLGGKENNFCGECGADMRGKEE